MDLCNSHYIQQAALDQASSSACTNCIILFHLSFFFFLLFVCLFFFIYILVLAYPFYLIGFFFCVCMCFSKSASSDIQAIKAHSISSKKFLKSGFLRAITIVLWKAQILDIFQEPNPSRITKKTCIFPSLHSGRGVYRALKGFIAPLKASWGPQAF